jgi:hypothetical protein
VKVGVVLCMPARVSTGRCGSAWVGIGQHESVWARVDGGLGESHVVVRGECGPGMVGKCVCVCVCECARVGVWV